MSLRSRCLANGTHRLADAYLMIAAAHEFDTLRSNSAQLCNLLFMNMLLIESKVCYMQETDLHIRRAAARRYRDMRRKEAKIRAILRAHL
jgi:hypothetical protein